MQTTTINSGRAAFLFQKYKPDYSSIGNGSGEKKDTGENREGILKSKTFDRISNPYKCHF
jgi:hypothetical protein